MKLNRKIFFKIHSWIGIKLSILFFIVCFSGTLATLSQEMDWLFFKGIRAIPSQELAGKNQIIENLQNKYPDGKMEYWVGSKAPYLCDIIYVLVQGQRYYVFANPYTGEIQGSTTLTFQRFFRDLHYYLFIPFQVGHFTVLIFAFMLFISFGTALLFYKKWYRKLFVLKMGKGRLVFFRSLHRLIGVWSVPFVMLFSVTGIWYFLERTNTANTSTIANTVSPDLPKNITDTAAFRPIGYHIDYDQAVKAAQSEIPNLVVKDIYPPHAIDDALYMTGTSDVALVRNRANRVYLHPLTYEVIKVQNAREINTITWLNDIADPLHFGYFGGLLTKFIWFLAGLSISGLVLTGIWISLKRKVKNEAQKRSQKLGIWKYVNWVFVGGVLFFMYYFLIVRYAVSIQALIGITLIWIVLITLTWYVFDYRIRKSVFQEQAKELT